MLQKIKLPYKNLLIGLFLVFFVFSIVGSNLYLYDTIFSFRNIFFPGLIVIIIALRNIKLSLNQILILSPVLLLYFYVITIFIVYRNFELEILKDFFY